MRTSPERAPWASDASTPASAYAPRSATRPFKPMQPERAQGDPVGGDDPLTADPQQRCCRDRRGECGCGAHGERRAQLTIETALRQPDELEPRGAADDRQTRLPRQPRRGFG